MRDVMGNYLLTFLFLQLAVILIASQHYWIELLCPNRYFALFFCAY